jgi:hypothetical protein
MLQNRRFTLLLGGAALALLGVLGVLRLRERPAEPGDLRSGSPVPSASATGNSIASQPRPAPPPPLQARPPAPSNGHRQRVDDWMAKARNYQAEDRAAVLDAALDSLVKSGAASVFELEARLAELSVYEQEDRAAVFHALGRIGKELLSSSDPEAKKALDAIQQMAKSELELASLIEPNPEVDLDALPAKEREELLHHGVLVQENGELWHPTALNKLAAIRMLRTVGGKESLAQLERQAKVKSNHVGVQLATEQAIQLANN